LISSESHQQFEELKQLKISYYVLLDKVQSSTPCIPFIQYHLDSAPVIPKFEKLVDFEACRPFADHLYKVISYRTPYSFEPNSMIQDYLKSMSHTLLDENDMIVRAIKLSEQIDEKKKKPRKKTVSRIEGESLLAHMETSSMPDLLGMDSPQASPRLTRSVESGPDNPESPKPRRKVKVKEIKEIESPFGTPKVHKKEKKRKRRKRRITKMKWTNKK